MLDFVPISSTTNPTNWYGIVDYDYRMGTFEITNDQWNKFKDNLNKPVTGDPSSAYDEDSYDTGTNLPATGVSWYEAAQFVNWLNTSTGHQVAYKFAGMQGTADYALSIWSAADAAGGTNLYRHKDAFYFLPTEDEWVKTACWNGTKLQNFATKVGESLTQGDGINGTGWNYYDNGHATNPSGPWNVGSGSEELNGTYDMMGNVTEWLESPFTSGDYGAGSTRGLRGGYWGSRSDYFAVSVRSFTISPTSENVALGFRVASVPEPSTFALIAVGALSLFGCARRRYAKVTVLAAAFAAIATTATADMIMFTQTGTGSGTIGTTPIVDAYFTITAFSDTENRMAVPLSGVLFEDHSRATIAIDGVGTYEFLSGTRTFVNQSSGQIGFSRAGVGGYDLFSNLNSPAFATWDMLTSIGPITGIANLKQWNRYSPVETTGGTLRFDDGPCSCTFQAVVGPVPEPSALVLLAAGGVTLLAFRWRQRETTP